MVEIERVCHFCNNFIPDLDDFETGLGVCLKDGTFDPFIDDIMENSSFACCFDLYLENRIEGDSEECLDFEAVEIIEIDDEDDIYGTLLHEKLKNDNVDQIIDELESLDSEIVKKALTSLSAYIAMGNNNAFEGLLNYYNELPPADSLGDVHMRMQVVKALAHRQDEVSTINAFVNELNRSPSNNQTRQLYTEILNILGRCPVEMVKEPLLQLFAKRQYSYRMKNRIAELIER